MQRYSAMCAESDPRERQNQLSFVMCLSVERRVRLDPMLKPGVRIHQYTRKPDGDVWDLTRPQDEKELESRQTREGPLLLIGPPPCACFCPLLRLQVTAEEGREEPHVRVAVEASWRRLASGRHFLHKHPACSECRSIPEIQTLIADPRVHAVKGPMCRWGMWHLGSCAEGSLREQTQWKTSSPSLSPQP